MLVKAFGAAVQGISAMVVTIEVNVGQGIRFMLVGLPDNAVKESHERVVSALEYNGYKFPRRQVVINMAPADVRKEGSAYDLPIAVGVMAAAEKIKADALGDYVIMGELSLDGSLRPIKGALPIAIRARDEGFKGLILPRANAREAAVVDCLKVYDQVRRRRYNVVMSGYYGFSNAGDDAILQSIQEGIVAASEDISITVLSNDPALTERLYGLDAVPRFQVWKVLRALRRCDALLSGGGSLLQDRTSTRSLLYYLSIIRLAERFHKPVMLYANGIGPVSKPANRRRVKKAVERAALVTLRDRSSAKELQDMGVGRSDLYVTADPVFNLPPAPEKRGQELLETAQLPQGVPFAAVSVRDWPGTGEFPRQLAALCDHLRRAYGMEILFLMMQPGHDRAATQQVRQAMEEPSYLLEESCTPQELMAVLGQARLCVAMRLHTLIFAARMAVPCLGLVYDPKVESYLQELELPSAGHVERFDAREAISCADRLMADYDVVLSRLRDKSQALAQAALRNEELLLQLLEGSATKKT